MTNSAPTICTDCAAVSPTSTAKPTATARTGTPAAAANTGSTLAKRIGRHHSTIAPMTTTATAANSHTDAEDTPTIWPVSSANAVDEFPGYK